MRQSAFFIGLIFCWLPPPAPAYDIEQEYLFAARNAAEPAILRLISTVDLELFDTLILAFQHVHPEIAIDYKVVNSVQLYQAIAEEQQPFDLAISSAMDLQVKLANDGYALEHTSTATQALPEWAKWLDRVFAFTSEPTVIIVSRSGFADLPLPQTRNQLIATLRDNPQLFNGKVGTYDVRISGFGYMLATQDSRQSDTYWRLSEVMGALASKLYCCSSIMIEKVQSGELLMAYNVLGSYAAAHKTTHPNIHIIQPRDYTNVMLRTMLIPFKAEAIAQARTFIDFILSTDGQQKVEQHTGMPSLRSLEQANANHLRPIRLGPGLLVYLDRLKRENFIDEWTQAIIQP